MSKPSKVKVKINVNTDDAMAKVNEILSKLKEARTEIDVLCADLSSKKIKLEVVTDK